MQVNIYLGKIQSNFTSEDGIKAIAGTATSVYPWFVGYPYQAIKNTCKQNMVSTYRNCYSKQGNIFDSCNIICHYLIYVPITYKIRELRARQCYSFAKGGQTDKRPSQGQIFKT